MSHHNALNNQILLTICLLNLLEMHQCHTHVQQRIMAIWRGTTKIKKTKWASIMGKKKYLQLEADMSHVRDNCGHIELPQKEDRIQFARITIPFSSNDDNVNIKTILRFFTNRILPLPFALMSYRKYIQTNIFLEFNKIKMTTGHHAKNWQQFQRIMRVPPPRTPLTVSDTATLPHATLSHTTLSH